MNNFFINPKILLCVFGFVFWNVYGQVNTIDSIVFQSRNSYFHPILLQADCEKKMFSIGDDEGEWCMEPKDSIFHLRHQAKHERKGLLYLMLRYYFHRSLKNMSSFQPIFKWTIGNQNVYLSSNWIFLFENEKFIKAKPLSPFLSPFINDNLHIFEARYTKVNDSIVDLSAVLKYLDVKKLKFIKYRPEVSFQLDILNTNKEHTGLELLLATDTKKLYLNLGNKDTIFVREFHSGKLMNVFGVRGEKFIYPAKGTIKYKEQVQTHLPYYQDIYYHSSDSVFYRIYSEASMDSVTIDNIEEIFNKKKSYIQIYKNRILVDEKFLGYGMYKVITIEKDFIWFSKLLQSSSNKHKLILYKVNKGELFNT